jgi:hypothetical protein
MFVALANHLAGGDPEENARRILSLDATTVSFLMESAWSVGGPGLLKGIPAPHPAPVGVKLGTAFRAGRTFSTVWDHLIYAYMIENTRAYDILGRVIAEYAQGERLGILREEPSYQWLRTTEELFYKDASPVQPFNLVSRLRPDIAATRRNAYYRMFGMDLNHGRDGAATYPYVKPAAANREFVATFEEFLREVWRAIENANNNLANNPTDFPAIQDLADRLQNMLTARRGGAFDRPNLAREEFLAVSLAAWLDLTLSFNSPIVRDLAATGPSPEERLRQIGDRVGLPAHGRSHSYFLIAKRVSTILIGLERGDFNDRVGAETLAAAGPVRDIVADVVHHWQLISGRDLKSPRVASLNPATRQPMGAATGQALIAPTPPAAMSALTPGSGAPGGIVPAAINGRVPAGSS